MPPGGLDPRNGSQLFALLDAAPVPMAVIEGPEHRYSFVNAAYRALPAPRMPAVGLRLGDCFPERIDVWAPRLNAMYRDGQGERMRDVEIHMADGARRFWDIECTPLHGANGAMHAVLVTAHDVTDKALAREAVAAALAEKDDLLKEVNHRIKNSLQLVSSLLTLQALTSRDTEMRRQLQEACGRIGTIAQVHQRLHSAESLQVLSVAPCLRDLCAELGSVTQAAQHGRRILVRADDAELGVDTVIPLTLAVNELVSNAMKYAYAEGQEGDVEVRFQVLPGGAKRLTVADHGRGLPEGFNPARADTLGMRVVRAFAGQLRGKLCAEDNAPGARFVLDLP
ncbi:MAG TPA: histidine kinase dimerization/phosphoacceptor domain -containing protein [Azospirillum sp.]